MWLILCWIFGLRSILFHLIVILLVISLIICHKLYSKISCPRVDLGSDYQRLISSRENLKDRIKFVVMRRFGQCGNGNGGGLNEDHLNHVVSLYATSRHHSNGGYESASNRHQGIRPSGRSISSRRYSISSLATLSLMLALVLTITGQSAFCLEEDAQILMPVANLAKSIIKTVSLGIPLEVNVDTTGIVKNFAYFTWRTGFPVSMPGGFMQKAQDFYNRVKMRVDQARVDNVERKSLVNLKRDLDDIVDGIVEQVRRSPEGLYTDYLQARVGNNASSLVQLPLEDACTLVGVQLKAYGVDLTNYRDIAGAVLGIPVMPTVASAMMNVASIGQSGLNVVQNLTNTALVRPLNATTALLLSRVPLSSQMTSALAQGAQVVPFGGLLFGNRQQQR